MPATAVQLGVDPEDLRSNIDGGAAYLAAQVRRFSGPAAVERYGDVPPYPETRGYGLAVLKRLGRYGGGGGVAAVVFLAGGSEAYGGGIGSSRLTGEGAPGDGETAKGVRVPCFVPSADAQ